MGENQKDLIKHLNSLIQLDIDATHAYQHAIDHIDLAEVRNRMVSFRADHERHITDLSAAVRELGGVPTENKVDIKGFFIEGFTAIRSQTGTAGAMKAMQSNEKLTTRMYEKARSLSMPKAVSDLIKRNYEDEQRHLRYVEQVLQERPWETIEKKAV
jgi:uncharacterized protein (TIGR02284 family)